MNNKSVAVGVYKNPAIQKLLKEGGISSSQINKLIVEEVMSEDEIDETSDHATKNINKLIKRLISKSMPKDVKTDAEVLKHIDRILDQIANRDEAQWFLAFPQGHKPEEKGGFSEEKKKAIAERAKTTKNKTLADLREKVKAGKPVACKDNKCKPEIVDKLHQLVAKEFVGLDGEGPPAFSGHKDFPQGSLKDWSDSRALAYLAYKTKRGFFRFIDEKVAIMEKNGEVNIYGDWHKNDTIWCSNLNHVRPKHSITYNRTNTIYGNSSFQDDYW